eukprot:2769388-Pyramimonas_sp.AAC.1
MPPSDDRRRAPREGGRPAAASTSAMSNMFWKLTSLPADPAKSPPSSAKVIQVVPDVAVGSSSPRSK